MPTNTTTHRLDTCGCVIAYDWERDSKEDERVHENYRALTKCPLHEHLSDQVAATVVTQENRTKNLAVNALVKAHPDLFESASSVEYSFDGNRNVIISVPDSLQKSALDLQATIAAAGLAESVTVS